ncbi:uncharacterized protein [Epargyreus clarus]|uniref:uncharacterized protein n=1 Tax=Epargyreus clarus TaxID=520877 RepID=UPI003C2C48F0
MDIESSSGDDSLVTIENSLPSDILAKLRRLKIQESLLVASLNKTNFERAENNEDSSIYPDWKVYTTKLRNSISEIKNMIEDIKGVTSDSHDNLKDIDIKEVKKDVLELDGKIKSLEDFINLELLSLQKSEEEIMKQLNEEPKFIHNIKRKVKIQSKQYNEVVPSPVRVLRNSPLKCAEVQRLQEFLSKSKNRYGGWNEYNHNSFIQIWNKFYVDNDIEILEKNMQEIINNNNLSLQFMDEVREKNPDVSTNEILSHSKWYSEYCYLKMCQQKALDKWKDNKQKIKRRQNVKRSSSANRNTEKLCRQKCNNEEYLKKNDKSHLREYEDIQSENSFDIAVPENILWKEETLRDVPSTNVSNSMVNNKFETKCKSFSRPTKQWINRCHSVHESSRQIQNNIETVDKLCVPNWRVCLK